MEQTPQGSETGSTQTWETVSVRGTGFAPTKTAELLTPPDDTEDYSETEDL